MNPNDEIGNSLDNINDKLNDVDDKLENIERSLDSIDNSLQSISSLLVEGIINVECSYEKEISEGLKKIAISNAEIALTLKHVAQKLK